MPSNTFPSRRSNNKCDKNKFFEERVSTTASDAAPQQSAFLEKLREEAALHLPSLDWEDALVEPLPSTVKITAPPVSTVHRRFARNSNEHRKRSELTPTQPRLSSFPCVTAADRGSVDFARSDSSSEWYQPVMGSAPPLSSNLKRNNIFQESKATAEVASTNYERPSSSENSKPQEPTAAPDLSLEDYSSTHPGPNSFFRSYFKNLSKRSADEGPPQPLSDSRRRIRRAYSGAPTAARQPTPPMPEASEEKEAEEVPNDSSLGASAKVRQHLTAMAGQIRGFESQLLTQIEQRKQASAGRLAVVRDAVTQLRRTLEVEINRRIEMQKELHTSLAQEVADMRSGTAGALEERRIATESIADQLRTRLSTAENAALDRLAQNEAKLSRISQAVDLMATQIDSFKNRLTADIQLRRQRSDVLFEKLAELEKAAQSRAAMEAGLRERDKESLTRQVLDLREEHQGATAALQEKLAQEFKELKDTLEKETKTREQADDDIVKALNHYTVALQNALRIANA